MLLTEDEQADTTRSDYGLAMDLLRPALNHRLAVVTSRGLLVVSPVPRPGKRTFKTITEQLWELTKPSQPNTGGVSNG